MRPTLVLLALLLLSAACRTSALPPDPALADIDRFVQRAMNEFPEVPSLGVAVVRDGKTVLTRGYGFADRERQIAADENTVYYIGSSTKSYTGLLAAVLASRGVVDLDAPISRYLPELTGPAASVPLRAWLSHTSGIDNSAVTMRTAFTGEHTPAQLVSILSRSTAVEKTFEYDNLGYVVAGLVFERVTGKPWQDLLADEVFAPLGMSRTTTYISRAAGWPVAQPYDLVRQLTVEALTFVKIDKTMHAAGGIVTSTRDLAKWLEANINRRGLPAAAFAEAQKQQVPVPESNWYRFRRYGYGLGWYQSDYENDLLIHHFGGYEGWRTHVSFLPKQRHGVAIATNTGGTGAPVRDVIAAYIYDRLLGKSDLDAKYTAELAKARQSANERVARTREDIEKRKQRPPSLTRAASVYAGTFTNESLGRLIIREDGTALRASLGQLSGTLEPFTEPESARVELIPGTGQVLRFAIGSDGRAETVQLEKNVFTRE